jgi:hypothetical protein
MAVERERGTSVSLAAIGLEHEGRQLGAFSGRNGLTFQTVFQLGDSPTVAAHREPRLLLWSLNVLVATYAERALLRHRGT